MNFDLTITVSVILALSAILSPIIVAIINNRYQLKVKQIETYYIAKRNAFEDFVKKSGEHISYYAGQTEMSMFNALYGLLPYFDIDIGCINSIIIASKSKVDLTNKINELIIILRKQMPDKRLK